ncbi:OmpA family protein [Sulfurospirillum sp. 1612]|uniref:OmpA family protein n=1 Tax=Sulfurospirillum sp. 1612 TaxID=3094835 RepID=UPI002F9565B8
MKKLVFVMLLASSFAFAGNYKYEITPMIGGVQPEGNMDIKSHLSYGLRFGINVEKSVIDQVELGYERSDKVEYKFTNMKTDIDRLFVNVLKFYPIKKDLSFYALAGAGYENLENHFTSNGDSGFVNYGVGLKYMLKDEMAIRAEVRHAINFKHGDNNLFYNVGFSIPFGKKAEPVEYKPEPVAKVAPKPAPVVVLDDDKDGVINEKDACPNTPMGVQVDEKGCELDSDHDGVVNSQDQCLNTPAGNVVMADGCEKVIHLKVEFAFDKADVPESYMSKIKEVSNFMSINKTYKVILEGNTDSIGSKKYNQALSVKRAKAVAGALETLGVASNRIITKGFGEMNPVASNKTAEGRAQNRRVDAKFNKGE